MASTRNKNMAAEYAVEKQRYAAYQSYHINPVRNEPPTPYLAGYGLIQQGMHGSFLSHNHVDIESDLFGIGSTNLEKTYVPPIPQYKSLQSVNIVPIPEKAPLPESLYIEPGQRPQRWT